MTDDEMMNACKAAVATCEAPLRAFTEKLKARTDLDAVQAQLVARREVVTARLGEANARLGNAEANLMLAEATAEIDGGEVSEHLSLAPGLAKKEVEDATAELARIDSALAILPARMSQADEDLESASEALKAPAHTAVKDIGEAFDSLLTVLAQPLLGGIVVGYALNKAGVCGNDGLIATLIPRTGRDAPPILKDGKAFQPDRTVETLAECIGDIAAANSLHDLVSPLGAAIRAIEREKMRIWRAREAAKAKR